MPPTTIPSTNGRPKRSVRNTLMGGYGLFTDAREGPTPEERVRAIANRLGWLPNDLPDLPTFRSNATARRTATRKMMGDEAVKGGLLQKVFGVAQLRLQSKPADENNPTDVDAAEFRRFVIEDRLPYGLPGLVESVGLHACIEDHSLCEPVWPAPGVLEENGKWKGKRVLADVKARPPSSYRIDRDQHDTVTGVRYTRSDGREVVDDPASFIIFRYLSLYDSPLSGYTDVEAAYNHFLGKYASLRARAIFEDRCAGGFLLGKGAANPNDQRLKDDFAAARSMGYLILGAGMDAEVLNLAGSAADVFRNSIEDKNKHIFVALTGAYLHVIESSNPNPRGSATTSLSGAELLQWHFASRLSSAFTRQLGHMIDAENFAGAGRGTLVLSAVDNAFTKSEMEVAVLVKQLVGPDKMSLSEVYRRSGWGPPKDPSDILGPPPPDPLELAQAKGAGNGKAGANEKPVPAGGAE
jgi:hypothetical protein